MTQVLLQTNTNAKQILLCKNNIQENKNLQNKKFEGKFGQIIIEDDKVFVGANFQNNNFNIDPFDCADYYALGAKITKVLSSTTFTEFELNCDFDITSKELEHLLLGLIQGSYNFDKYIKSPKSVSYTFCLNPILASKIYPKQLRYITTISQSVSLARDLVNDTPAAINPSSISQLIDKQFENLANVSIKKIDYKEMVNMGMEGITAVGKASEHKPILVHTVVKPSNKVCKKIVLIGKGLTYDCGGLDIKGGGHMKDMKSDMGGSATMFGVTLALAKLGLENVELHWISAFAENMIDSNAYKSDDILTTYSGQTVEIFNTDAEGRLTLADALSYATLLDPDYIVDAATLTGACIVALSEYFTALMSNNLEFKNKLIAKFESENEPTIYTPMPERLRQYVQGDISDLNNTSTLTRQSGHITAGLFLSHFVNQNNFRNPKLDIKTPKNYPWIHLDIAGTAFNKNHNSLNTKGATGQTIRSLVSWILDEDSQQII